MCTSRAEQGYNSGMGEIFRKVASISPIQLLLPDASRAALPSSEEAATERLSVGANGETAAV